jgi:anti-anti-sigma factor
MTKQLSPLPTLPAGRTGRRPAPRRTTVVRLVGDLDARPRQLRADLAALLHRDTTLMLYLRGATFLGADAARLLLDLRAQAAASGVRLVLWRPNGQPYRTLRIARLDRLFDLRPASWRPYGRPTRADRPPARGRDHGRPAPAGRAAGQSPRPAPPPRTLLNNARSGDCVGDCDAPGVSRRSGRESQPWLDDELARRVMSSVGPVVAGRQARGGRELSSAPRRCRRGGGRG